MIRVHTGYAANGGAAKSLSINEFKGVDLTNDRNNVDESRSPEAPNIMPDENRMPVKRPGYWRMFDLGGKIYGRHRYKVGDTIDGYFIHAGNYLYFYGRIGKDGGEQRFHDLAVTSKMADDYSSSVQLKNKLWILDGKEYKAVWWEDRDGEDPLSGGFRVKPVSEIAYVPIITKGKRPPKEGAADSFEPFNLLTAMVEEDFTIIETESSQYATNTREFFTSKKIDTAAAGPVTAKVIRYNTTKKENEEFEYTEGNGFSVDRAAGKITFDTAPGASMPIGEDTVFIKYPHVYEIDDKGKDKDEAAKSLQDGLQKVNNCRFCVLYGVKGAMDRIFMAGNPAEPNVDRWSDFEDPTYIGDKFYSSLGTAASPITGYSILSNCLVTHKRNEENDRNAFVRYGTEDEDDNGVFAITNVIQGAGCVSDRATAAMSSEPVFLSSQGVFAMTANDLSGERYQQKRSYYIDGALSGADLTNAPACVWKNFYVLAAGDRLYLLDTSQKSYAQQNNNSNYQYECFYWTGIHATALWSDDDDRLWFGDENGNVFRFLEGKTRAEYQDWNEACGTAPEPTIDSTPGTPIEARWATPMLTLGSIGHKKNISEIWAYVNPPYSRGGVTILLSTNLEFEKVIKRQRFYKFDFNDINFNDWSFITMSAPESARVGRKFYNVNSVQIIAENKEAKESFGLQGLQLDYSLSNKTEVKG